MRMVFKLKFQERKLARKHRKRGSEKDKGSERRPEILSKSN